MRGEIQRQGTPTEELCDKLGPGTEPFRAVHADLGKIVEKSHKTEARNGRQTEQDHRIVRPRPKQRCIDDRPQNQDAPHGGRAAFGTGFRRERPQFVGSANGLTDLQLRQFADHPGPTEDANEQCGNRGKNCPERRVLKHAQWRQPSR